MWDRSVDSYKPMVLSCGGLLGPAGIIVIERSFSYCKNLPGNPAAQGFLWGADMLTPSRAIEDALRRYRPGWTLEQFFYTNEELFEYERRTWLARQWYLVAHVSEVPKIGSYIVREVLGESLIIVRTAGNAILGVFNVCRHRGSPVCREDGTAAVFTCPYHAWSYSLDGRLRGATALIEGSDKSELGLKPVQLTESGGLLFCTLDPAAAK